MKNDIAYNNLDFIPGAEGYFERWADEAQDFRASEAAVGRARLNVPYGPTEREKFDLFHPAGRAEGLIVFIHGGYWRRFDRGYWSHFSRGLTQSGLAVAMPSYPLAPDARIHQITHTVAKAVTAAANLIQGPITITGHSAGGHLAGRMLCRDVAIPEAVRERVQRAVLISPVAVLAPLLETTMNETFRLDADEAESESLTPHTPMDVPITTWVGAEERPAFLDQNRWIAEAWGAEERMAPGRHHLDILEDLEHADSPLVRSILST